MANGRPWTNDACAELLDRARAGELFGAIAQAMNRPSEGIRSKYLDLVRRMKPRDRAAIRRDRDVNLQLAPAFHLATQDQIADARARACAIHPSLTAAFCGDLPPGRSALDQKRFATTTTGETHASDH